jgi:hypothetical protein
VFHGDEFALFATVKQLSETRTFCGDAKEPWLNGQDYLTPCTPFNRNLDFGRLPVGICRKAHDAIRNLSIPGKTRFQDFSKSKHNGRILNFEALLVPPNHATSS